MCEHLQHLDDELRGRGVRLTFRGRAWSRNCREWAYYDCHLDTAAIRERLALPPCVVDHVNDDPKSGTERGLVCTEHHDAVIGRLEPAAGVPTIR